MSAFTGAADGDVLLLQDGTYTGHGEVSENPPYTRSAILTLGSKGITLRAENPHQAILDGQFERVGLNIFLASSTLNHGPIVVLDGLSITRGDAGVFATGSGGGIAIQGNGGRVEILNCRIYSNAAQGGGGIRVWSQTSSWFKVAIINTIFFANLGGVSALDCSAHFGDYPIFLQNVAFYNHSTVDRFNRSRPIVSAAPGTLNFSCPLGQWMSRDGAVYKNFEGCLYDCLPGTYGASPFLRLPDECTACPSGKTSLAGAAGVDACSCPATSYDDGDACVTCPVSVNCTAVGVTLAALPVNPNYWRVSATSAVVMPCYTDGVCVGVSAAAAGRRLQAALALESSSTYGDGLCREGHTGPYCEVCRTDWYKGIDGFCVDCATEGGSVGASVPPECLLMAS